MGKSGGSTAAPVHLGGIWDGGFGVFKLWIGSWETAQFLGAVGFFFLGCLVLSMLARWWPLKGKRPQT